LNDDVEVNFLIVFLHVLTDPDSADLRGDVFMRAMRLPSGLTLIELSHRVK